VKNPHTRSGTVRASELVGDVLMSLLSEEDFDEIDDLVEELRAVQPEGEQ
jgi:hypothetical protein